MTAKEYLEQVGKIDRMITFTYEEIKYLKGLATSISANIGGEKVCSSKKLEAPFVKHIEKLVEKEKEAEKEIEELNRTKEDVIKSIEQLNDFDEVIILKYKHIYNFTWSEISERMSISPSTARRLYKKAFDNFSMIFLKKRLI